MKTFTFPLLLVLSFTLRAAAAPAAPAAPSNVRMVTQPVSSTPVSGTPIANGRYQLTPTGAIPGQQAMGAPSDALIRSNNIVTGNFGMADVQGLILELQSTIDLTLPVLAKLTSGNAGIDPTTGLPRQLVNTATTGRTPATYFGTAGTNAVQLDPQTFQTLVILQNHLQQTRLVLRDLNAAERLAVPQNAQPLTPTGIQPQLAPAQPIQPRPVAPAVPHQRILQPAGQQ